MPNWITNKLYIVGPTQDITEFKAKSRDSYYPAIVKVDRLKTKKPAWTSNSFFPIKEREDKHQSGRKRSKPVVVDLSFDRMVPVPLEVTKKPYIKLEYNFMEDPVIPWCIKHWGCKWDAYGSKLLRESRRRLFYIFYTPWNPPYAWLKRVSKKYPRLHFTLHYWDSAPRVIIWAIKGELWGKKKK